MRRAPVAVALVVSLLAGSAAAGPLVVVVRHAEKADSSRDPALSESGLARARALGSVFASAPPTHVFVTPLRRTRETAAGFDVEPVVVPLDQGTEFHVKQTVDAVRALPERATVLVVGHSNTVPAIVRSLGGAAADIPDCEYDRLTVIDLRAAATAATVTARYGATSVCPAA